MLFVDAITLARHGTLTSNGALTSNGTLTSILPYNWPLLAYNDDSLGDKTLPPELATITTVTSHCQ